MDKKIVLPLLPLFSLLLCSCGNSGITHEIEEYCLQMPYKNDFRILQLNDIHIGDKDNRQLHYDYLDLTIRDANPDFIVLNGDIFTFASRFTAEELFKFIDSHNIPWTATFGNHDEQCYFSIDWLTGYLNNFGSYCLFKDIQDDEVFGNCNFSINLMNGDDLFEMLIMMDSNRYYFGSYFGYDYIKQDQIDWYERIINYARAEYANDDIHSLAFFHIPLPEFEEAWNEYENGNSRAEYLHGEHREKVCSPDINSGFFNKMADLGSTDGVFCAHDHRNNYAIKYYDITLSYGVNSTDRVYYDPDMMGGQVIILHNDHTFTIEQIFHTYEELIR